MRISVSNIAWDIAEESAAADLLAEAGVRLVDVAPGKYVADPRIADPRELERVRRWWDDRGFRIVGLQGLLFGTEGLNLFRDEDGEMLDRLQAQCRVAAALGADALTFGSPRQRDRQGLDDQAAREAALPFFARIGDVAAACGVAFCLEPVAAAAGCNFLTTTQETAALVEDLAHPGLRLQLDVGALAANGEDPGATIAAVAPLIGHVHASEPELAVLGDRGAPHAAAGEALRRLRLGRSVTVEMARPAQEPPLHALARAVAVAQAAYGDTP